MKRSETGIAMRAIRAAWPEFRLGRGELDRWQYDLGLLDLAQVLAAVADRQRVGAGPPSSTADLELVVATHHRPAHLRRRHPTPTRRSMTS